MGAWEAGAEGRREASEGTEAWFRLGWREWGGEGEAQEVGMGWGGCKNYGVWWGGDWGGVGKPLALTIRSRGRHGRYP